MCFTFIFSKKIFSWIVDESIAELFSIPQREKWFRDDFVWNFDYFSNWQFNWIESDGFVSVIDFFQMGACCCFDWFIKFIWSFLTQKRPFAKHVFQLDKSISYDSMRLILVVEVIELLFKSKNTSIPNLYLSFFFLKRSLSWFRIELLHMTRGTCWFKW